jgi:hypothetical protein
MKTRLIRAAVIFTGGFLVSILAARGERPPKFDSTAFSARYEAAFRDHDLYFFEELFSQDFWLGRQFPTSSAAVAYLRGVFAQYSETRAHFAIDHVRHIAGGRAIVIDATLTLTGRGPGESEIHEIANTTGSSFFVLERGRWRIYKNIERLSAQADE